MIRFLCQGNWSPYQLSLSWVPSTRKVIAEVEAAIDRAWKAALESPGVNLFDGPMCRLESWEQTGDQLRLTLSKSTYKIFLGTNMAHPEFARKFGPEVMANPVGLSPALLTADGYLLLGRRNSSVAYYPDRTHPFSGCLEPKDADLFSAVARELQEEISLGSKDITDIRCIGIAEDLNLVQPEFIFAVKTCRTQAEVTARLDEIEHRSVHAIPATVKATTAALKDAQLTPIAIASLLLWGRIEFGQSWFEKVGPA